MDKEKTIKSGRKARPVVCLNTGQIYSSASEVAELTGFKVETITRACASYNRTCGWSNERKEALQWAYEVDVLKGIRTFVPGLESRKSVICITTGEVFESVTVAAKALGVDPADIHTSCKGKTIVADKDAERDAELKEPLQWAYWMTYRNNRKPPKPLPNKRRKEVICLTTGVVYDSQTKACEAHNLNASAMSKCVNRISEGRRAEVKCKVTGQQLMFMDYTLYKGLKDVDSYIQRLQKTN